MLTEFLLELKHKGVNLFVQDGKLKFKAAKDTLTDDIKSKIQSQKPAIIEFLTKLKTDSFSITFPSYAQQRLWFVDQLEQGSAQYNMPGAFRLEKAFNQGAFEAAIRTIIERHAVLRTNMVADSGKVYQVVYKTFDLPVTYTDLSHLEGDQQEREVKRLAKRDAEKVFNLSQDLMLRIEVLKLNAQCHHMLFNMHHIASDGWSMGILVNEFATLYGAFSKGQQNPLEPLKVQYADYANWQRAQLSEQVINDELAYWQQRLKGLSAVQSLPQDRQRKVQQSLDGFVLEHRLDKQLGQRLAELSRQQNITLFMLMQTAFSVLLSRLGDEPDIAMGTPISGRTHRDIEELIGYFANTLVLRTTVDANVSFEALLKTNKADILDAYEHQQLPFELLVDDLKLARDLSYSPLVQVVFALESAPPQMSDEINIVAHEAQQTASKFDLVLRIVEDQGQMTCEWTFATDLFDKATIAKLGDGFEALLSAVVANPKILVGDLNLLSDSDKRLTEQAKGDCVTLDLCPELPNVSEFGVVIADSNKRMMPPGIEGQVLLCGEQINLAYAAGDESFKQRFIADSQNSGSWLYPSGKLGRLTTDGQLQLSGELEQRVELNGIRLNLKDIGQRVATNEFIKDVVVRLGVNEGEMGLVAYVVATEAQADVELYLRALQLWLKKQLPAYIVPDGYALCLEQIDLDNLPEPQWLQDLVYVEPQTEIEVKLAEIWAELLEVDRVGLNDNFFMLGGNSLTAVRLEFDVLEAFDLTITVRDVFENADLRALANFIENGAPSADEQLIEAVSREQDLTLSFAQRRLWFIDQLENNDSHHYNIPIALRLKGQLDKAALTHAIKALVERHEVLRTVYEQGENGEARQLICNEFDFALNEIDLTNTAEPHLDAKVREVVTDLASQPFDLSNDLMLRVGLLSLSDDDFVMTLNIHHIAADGWSMGVMVKEITAEYTAFLNQGESDLPPMPIQYADFAAWQQQFAQQDAFTEQMHYWKEQLVDLPKVHNIPLDKVRPAQPTYAGKLHRLEIEPALLDKLNILANDTGTSLFMVLQTAFTALASRFSGEKDIALGTPVSGRTHSQLAPLVGFFVNTLVLRHKLDDSTPFNQMLEQVKQTSLQAFENQDVPFEMLVEQMDIERGINYSPLFQLFFTVQNNEIPDVELPSVKASVMETEVQTAKFDLSVQISEEQDGCFTFWEYNTDLFCDQTIERMALYYNLLLEQVVNDPKCLVLKTPLLIEQDQKLYQDKIATFGLAEHSVSEGFSCLHHRFEANAAKYPEHVAGVFGDIKLSYRELNEIANQQARYLLSQGVQSNELVGLHVERSMEMLVGMLAILKAGAAYVPLDPTYPDSRLAHMVEDGGIKRVLSQSHLNTRFIADSVEIVCIDDVQTSKAIAQCETSNLDELTLSRENSAYVIYTSGSTGKPKGVPIEHAHVLSMFDGAMTYRHHEFDENDCWTMFHSFSFDFSVWEIWGALLFGGRVVIVPFEVSRSAEAFYELIKREQVTVLSQTPSAFYQLSNEVLANPVNLSLRCIYVGGEALEPAKFAAWIDYFGDDQPVLNNVYGITETTVFVSFRRIYAADCAAPSSIIGAPFDSLTAYVCDEHMNLQPVGVAGEMYIGGGGVAQGYMNRPELTAERFIKNPFDNNPPRLYRTGDVVRWTNQADLEYFSRIDHQTQLRGFRIELGEIEYEVFSSGLATESKVLIRDTATGHQQLVAYVVPKTSGSEWIEPLRVHLSEVLPIHMMPSAYVEMDSIPLTANGKVDRKALPNPDMQSQHEYVAPKGEIELGLAEIWQQLLSLDQVSADASFFELGGHSLLVTKLASAVTERFSVTFTVRDLFEKDSVAAQAKYIAQMEQSEQITIAKADRSEPLPLSFAQQRLWFIDRLESGSAHYNMPAAVMLEGDLNKVVMQQAFEAIIERHEILRTVYLPGENGQGAQKIQSQFELDIPVFDFSDVEDAKQKQAELIRTEAGKQFDLSNDLMLRVALIKYSGQKHVVLFNMHHIASDGWSMDILIKEFISLYSEKLEGRATSLAELEIQYGDFAAWQKSPEADELLKAQLGYWKEQLADVPQVHYLPTANDRNAIKHHSGKRITRTIDAAVTRRLNELASQHDATLFMTLHGAMSVLISRWSQENDILMGVPLAGRTHAQLSSLIGFFINTLVLRSQLDDKMSFEQVLLESKQTALDAYDHQDVPFDQLVDVLKADRGLGQSPLFQVMLALQNNEGATLELPNLTLTPIIEDSEFARFELILNIQEEDGGLTLAWEYMDELFDGDTIAAMADGFELLLTAIAENPQTQVKCLPVVPQDQQGLLGAPMSETAVKHKGYRVDLARLALELNNHEYVKAAKVAVVERDGIEALAAFIEPYAVVIDAETTLSAVSLWFKAYAPEHEVPEAFALVEGIEKTDDAQLIWNDDIEHQAPATATEKALANIWQELMDIEEVSPQDNFFDLGGSSITAARMEFTVLEVMDVSISIGDIFERPVLADLAAFIDVSEAGGKVEIPIISRDQDLLMSASQQRLWFIDQLGGGSVQYNMPTVLKLTGDLNFTAMQKAIDTIVERHEVLRTSYRGVDGKGFQVIEPHMPVTVGQIDLRDVPQRDRLKRARILAEADARRPFDLSQAPVLRATLLRLEDDECVLVFNMHHIASDGWTMGVLINEFNTLYQAYNSGNTNPLTSLEVQYADYAHWQNDQLQGDNLKRYLDFWRSELQDAPALHNLPLDRARPAKPGLSDGLYQSKLDHSLQQALNKLANDNEASLFMVLNTAFACLLGRLSNETDIVMGTPVANRDHPELATMMGCFVNTLVMRTKLSKEQSFSELLQLSKERILAAFEHQQMPFESLVSELLPNRSTSHNPLFQVMFVLQNVELDEVQLPNLKVERMEQEHVGNDFDITLAITEGEDGLSMMWSYSQTLFDASTIENMAEFFAAMLQGISANPEQNIYQLPLLNPAKENALIERHAKVCERQVTLNGYRIDSSEIEHQLSNLTGIKSANVLVMGEDESRHLVGYLVAEQTIDNQKNYFTYLHDCLTDSLPSYMVPAGFVLLDSMPTDTDGKIDKKALPLPDMPVLHEYVAPSTNMEFRLTEVWLQLLPMKKVSIKASFFELGGHSLLVTKLASAISARFDVEVGLIELFEHDTIETQARFIQAQEKREFVEIPAADRNQPLSLSFAQARLWFIDSIQGGSAQYNMPAAVELNGDLDKVALNKAIDEIISRHEVLRTVYRTGDNGLAVQVINPATSLTIEEYDLSQVAQSDAQQAEIVRAQASKPFDLSDDLMLRVGLIKYNEQRHVLMFNIHHIASDGWSMGVLVKEFVTLYSDFLLGGPSSLKPLAVQYADFALWQREYLEGERLNSQIDYWSEKLHDLPNVHYLPTIKGGRLEEDFSGKRITRTLSKELTFRVNQLAVEHDTTLFMTMHAAMAALMSRWSNESDVVMGTPIAGRTHEQLSDLIGFFINTLVLRADLSDNPSFVELMAQSKETALGAFDNQDVPFDRLVDILKADRSLGQSPVFQVMLALQNNDDIEVQLPGLTLKDTVQQSEFSRFELMLNIDHRGGQLIFGWEYMTAVFEEHTVAAIAEGFEQMLNAIVEAPQTKISQLPILVERDDNPWSLSLNMTLEDEDCPEHIIADEATGAIVGANLEAVPMGVEGELVIMGEGFNLPSGAEPLPEDDSRWVYHTGKLGSCDTDGVLKIAGSVENRVHFSGYRVKLETIETVLCSHEAIAHAKVTMAVNDGKKALNAYLQPNQAVADAEQWLEACRLWLKDRILPFLLPQAFALVEDVEQWQQCDSQLIVFKDDKFEAPVGEIETRLASVWQELLKIEDVGRNDSFFVLGGNSLAAARLEHELQEVFEVKLSIKEIFGCETLADMAQLIEHSNQATLDPITLVSRDNILPLSFAQRRMWFINQLEGADSHHYNMPIFLKLQGRLDVEAMASAIKSVVERHEILRTVYTSDDDGNASQVILNDVDFAVAQTDLSNVASSEVEAKLGQIAEQELAYPFDLTTDLMLRARLVTLGVDDYVLMISMHHIASDGWSLGVMTQEIIQFYVAAKRAVQADIPALEVQYADYAAWQAEKLQSEQFQEQINYWKQQLAQLPAVHNLPLDKPRPPQPTFKGLVHSVEIGQHMMSQAKELANQTGSSMFMVMQAVFTVLMSRYSGDKDIVLGTPINGRTHRQVSPLIGFFVNTLVLRHKLDGDAVFADVLEQVKQTTLAAFDHQDVPFEMLVEQMDVSRSINHSPLFQVLFTVQNQDNYNVQMPDIKVSSLDYELNTAKFDLSVNVAEGDNGGAVLFEYSTDLFNQDSIERMGQYFVLLLDMMTSDTQTKVLQAPMLLENDSVFYAKQLEAFGNQSRNVSNGHPCLHQVFEAQAQTWPERIAVKYSDEQLSYSELNEKANQLAHHLCAEGVKPDELIGLYVERSIDMLIGLLAILKAGGAYVPLDPSYPESRLEYMVEDAGIKRVVTQSHLKGAFLPHSVSKLYVNGDSLSSYPVSNQNGNSGKLSSSNAAYVIYTSGSTGKPKGVVIEHANVLSLFDGCDLEYQFDHNDCWTMFHSFSFDFSVWEIWGALCYGGRLIVVPYELSRSTDEFYDLLQQEQVTVLSQTPSAFYPLASEVLNEPKDLALRYVVFGGEALEPAKLKRWVAHFGDDKPQLCNMYGITETTVHVTWRRIFAQDCEAASSVIGQPLKHLHAYVCNEHMALQPVGVAGELYIGGDGVARQYLDREDLTQERFIKNPYGDNPPLLYKTGDVARWTKDGELEYFTRIDHQAKLRGFRIELGEVEHELAATGLVRESSVLIKTSDSGYQQLIGYVVPADDDTESLVKDLRMKLGKVLPEYMVPAAFVVLDKMPITANGKVDRAALLAQGNVEVASSKYVAPVTDMEKVLCDIWAEVLELDKVGIQDNFFAVGGDSMRVVKIVKKAQAEGIYLQVKDIFAWQTIAAVCNAYDGSAGAERTIDNPAPVHLVDEAMDVTPYLDDRIQEAFGVDPLQKMMLDRHAEVDRDMAVYQPVMMFEIQHPSFQVDKLKQVLYYLLQKHPNLRSTFAKTADGNYVQQVLKEPQLEFERVDLRETATLKLSGRINTIIKDDMARGFELGEPCIRFKLLQGKKNFWGFYISTHHAVEDGWGFVEVMNDMLKLYVEIEEGGELPPLTNGANVYKEHVALGLECRDNEQYKQAWQQLLSDYKAMEQLEVVDAKAEKRRKSIGVEFKEDLVAGVERAAQEQNVPLRAMFLLAYQRALSKFLETDNVVLDVVSSGRSSRLSDPFKSVGLFWNLLPVTSVNESDNIAAVKQLTDKLLKADEFALYPIDKIQQITGLAEPTQFAFNFVNFHNENMSGFDEHEGKSMKMAYAADCFHHELKLAVASGNGKAKVGMFEYSQRYFKKATVKKLAKLMQKELAALVL